MNEAADQIFLSDDEKYIFDKLIVLWIRVDVWLEHAPQTMIKRYS